METLCETIQSQQEDLGGTKYCKTPVSWQHAQLYHHVVTMQLLQCFHDKDTITYIVLWNFGLKSMNIAALEWFMIEHILLCPQIMTDDIYNMANQIYSMERCRGSVCLLLKKSVEFGNLLTNRRKIFPEHTHSFHFWLSPSL